MLVCLYTYILWIEVVGKLLGRPPDPVWESTLEHLTTHGFDRLVYILLKFIFQMTIQMIWREREKETSQEAEKSNSANEVD